MLEVFRGRRKCRTGAVPDAGRNERDRGAVGLEFALVVPFLILIIMGSIEFSYHMFAQSNVSHSAREGAREMAISRDAAASKDQAVAASKLTGLTTAHVVVAPDSCTPGNHNAEVTVNYAYETFTGWFGEVFVVVGTGVMRCGG